MIIAVRPVLPGAMPPERACPHPLGSAGGRHGSPRGTPLRSLAATLCQLSCCTSKQLACQLESQQLPCIRHCNCVTIATERYQIAAAAWSDWLTRGLERCLTGPLSIVRPDYVHSAVQKVTPLAGRGTCLDAEPLTPWYSWAFPARTHGLTLRAREGVPRPVPRAPGPDG
jgi:hypothetical protein